jgi:hypothetical protein
MKKYLLPGILLLFIAYLVFDFFFTRHRISNLHYGVKANDLRVRLHIPIIDDYMKAKNKYNAFFGNRWESGTDLPKDQEPMHVWKTVTPLTDTTGLNEEMDAYRKKLNDTLYFQMNIYSKVQGDTQVTRHGKLFYNNYNKLLDIDLTDIQIDSVSISWRLKYLVRGK